jgi:hypothetical protein
VSQATRQFVTSSEGNLDKSFTAWANTRNAPGARLVAFESWLYGEMAKRLVWPTETAARERMIGQCRAFIVEAVGDMQRHGFLFADRELAALLREKLDQIARLQKLGKVDSLYPYFRACWSGWVRREADSLRDRAMSAGSHVNQITQRVLALGRPAATSMAEIVGESIREQAAAARRQARQDEAEAACQPNFLFTEPELSGRKRR